MVRILVLLLVLLAGSAFAVLFAIRMLLDDVLLELGRDSSGSSIQFSVEDYGKLRWVENGLVFEDIRALGVIRSRQDDVQSREFDLSIEKIRLDLLSYSQESLKVAIEIDGLNAKGERLVAQAQSTEPRLDSVTELGFRSAVLLEGSPFMWKAQFLQRVREIHAWAFADRPIQNLETRGQALVLVGHQLMPVRFHSVTNSRGQVHLEGNVEDLHAVAKAIEPKFTDADLQVAAKNLLKAPRLLTIRNKAEMQAVQLKNRDPEILYDVPRHIFWSYWLAQAFGSDFAREVTAAHEIGDTSSSPANTAIDHHHNELGIEYAKRQLTEAEVEKLIFEDPRVVRIKVGAH